MKRVFGKNVKTDTDATGGLISVDWTCPHCGFDNFGFYFSSNAPALQGDFEVDHECDICGEMTTIICRNAKNLFNKEENTMNNSRRITPVAERYTMSPRAQINTGIDWKVLLLELIRAIRNNSTFLYNGNARTIEYEYNGCEKQFRFSSTPTIRKFKPDELAEE